MHRLPSRLPLSYREVQTDYGSFLLTWTAASLDVIIPGPITDPRFDRSQYESANSPPWRLANALSNMPNTPSAIKRLRQNETRKTLNRANRSNMRTQLRRVREAVQAGELDRARQEFRLAAKKLDRAAAKNLIHKNAAARTKSRLNALIKNAATAS